MKRNLHFIAIILCFLLNKYKLLGQIGPEAHLINPAPLSPNAASIQRFGDVPVGYYTGLPNIDIPVYNIKTTHLELPISLNYHAGGVKIEDVPSWVGLGWAINAGGVITRNVRGLPDEGPFGYFNTSHLIDSFPNMNNTAIKNYYYSISNNMADPQPDMFSFQAGPLSGKFHFHKNSNNIVCIPQKRIKIQYLNTGSLGGGFLITNTDGVKYYFLDIEESSSFSSTLPLSGNGGEWMVNSWYLTKIISPDDKDSITFEYETQSCIYNSISTDTRHISPPSADNACGKHDVVNYSENSIAGKSIKKISFKNGSITFLKDTIEREDLQYDRALKTIIIINLDSTFVKKLRFFHSYTFSSPNVAFSSNDYYRKRMYLDSLVISDGISDDQKYSMDYYGRDSLPGRLSFNSDFWGYFNGSNNQSLRPAAILSLQLIAPQFPYYIIPYSGADRTARLPYGQCGSLKLLTYPTGGSSEFIYESNRVYNFYEMIEPGLDQCDTTVNVSLVGDPSGIVTSYSKSFSIERDFGRSGQVMAKIRVGLPGSSSLPPPPLSAYDPDVRLIMPDSSYLPLRNNVDRLLPVGNYQITVDFSNNPDSTLISNFYITLEYDYGVLSDTNKLYNTVVGGLRIRKILNREGNNVYTRRYEYEDSNHVAAHQATGILTDFPTFFNYTENCIPDVYTICQYINFSSGGHSSLSTTNGNYIAYYKVTEYNSVNDELGKSVYHYSYFNDLGSYREFPYPPPCSMDWLRGVLLKEQRYRNENGNYLLAHEKIFNYDFNNAQDDSFKIITKAVQIGKLRSDCEWLNVQDLYASVLSDTRTGWLRLNSDTSIEYIKDQPGYKIINTNSYAYNPYNFEVDTTVVSSSNGAPIKIVNRYPLDYQITGSPVEKRALAIKALRDKNIINPIIEKQTFRKINGSDVLLTSIFNNYDSSTLMVDTVHSLITTVPITNFTASTIVNNSVVMDNRYQPELIYYGFDSNNNITCQGKKNDVLQSYIWDYTHSYVVSHVDGAKFNDIAYTSFEADGSGNWIIGSSLREINALTGRKSYGLSNGDISRANLNPNTEYWLSYWKKDSTALTITGTQGPPQEIKESNGWTCYVHKINGVSSVTLSGTGIIDELRLYPWSSQMTTYTFDPLVGITSQCDIRNNITYYEYDGFGRLKWVRDQDKNILKSFEYKFQQP